MKFSRLELARILVILFPAVGLLLGISYLTIYPLWIALTALVVVITLIVWHKEGRSFKPLVPMVIVLLGAIILITVWSAFQR
jgi:hypothetical protein